MKIVAVASANFSSSGYDARDGEHMRDVLRQGSDDQQQAVTRSATPHAFAAGVGRRPRL